MTIFWLKIAASLTSGGSFMFATPRNLTGGT